MVVGVVEGGGVGSGNCSAREGKATKERWARREGSVAEWVGGAVRLVCLFTRRKYETESVGFVW